MPKLSRRMLLGMVAASPFLMAGRMVANAYHFQVNYHKRTLTKLRYPLRLALLSDLHIGPYIHTGSLKAWVKATMDARPELILITGDFIDYAASEIPEGFGDALAGLKAPLGVYGVWGNHDRPHR